MAADRLNLGAVVTMLEKLDKRVFGNGQPGLAQELRRADEENRRDVEAKHKENREAIEAVRSELSKFKWIGVGVIIATGFLGGSGMFSMDHVAKLLGFLK